MLTATGQPGGSSAAPVAAAGVAGGGGTGGGSTGDAANATRVIPGRASAASLDPIGAVDGPVPPMVIAFAVSTIGVLAIRRAAGRYGIPALDGPDPAG